jgi:bifunctional non-homologous end joining protein LigD
VIRGLSKQLTALEVETPQYEGTVSARRGPLHYVKPELVASVRFGGWTDDGTIRFPVFRGLRPDIAPKDCRAAPPAGDDPPLSEGAPETQSGRVLVSNRNKVFWPEDGYTKGDLVDYYAAVAKVMVPFLADRPVVLVRYPDGIYGKSFFQWRAPRGTPDWIETLELRDEEDQEARGTKSVFLINEADALVHIANLGAIPIHVLASRAQDLGCGDFFTIDFDIELSTLPVAVTLAFALRELLDEARLTGYPKTSGKTGLHVLVPVGPNVPFTVTKALAELFGRLIVGMHPDLATMERRVSERGQRVYVDTGQTGRGRTIVAPYSVREVPGATVSTPLAWEELSAALNPKRFDLRSVPLRIEEQGDPMADMLAQRPDVASALARLEERVRGLG